MSAPLAAQTAASNLDPLRIRRALGRAAWGVPEPLGPDGWTFVARGENRGSVIVTCAPWDDGIEWCHASIARPDMPTYDDLVLLHRAVWGPDGWAYQLFAPAADHVNLHAHALHLWGRLDGAAVLPNFGAHGTI